MYSKRADDAHGFHTASAMVTRQRIIKPKTKPQAQTKSKHKSKPQL